jgi:hypothetical protein
MRGIGLVELTDTRGYQVAFVALPSYHDPSKFVLYWCYLMKGGIRLTKEAADATLAQARENAHLSEPPAMLPNGAILERSHMWTSLFYHYSPPGSAGERELTIFSIGHHRIIDDWVEQARLRMRSSQ